MRRECLVALVFAATILAGCTTVDDRGGTQRRKDASVAPLSDDGQMVASYLEFLDRLGGAGPAEQATILQQTHSAFLADPSTQHRLRYALALAVPGHLESDPDGARSLLDETLAVRETLLPSERALAEFMVRELDARLALTHELASLRDGGGNYKPDLVAGLNQQLQLEIAEKERLRRELQLAQAKLEAIAALESGKAEPKP
ncbi:MAG: hypothetical protein WBO00_00065 [Steroidobacteraceae bacterium]